MLNLQDQIDLENAQQGLHRPGWLQLKWYGIHARLIELGILKEKPL